MNHIRNARKNDEVRITVSEDSDEDPVVIIGTVMDKDPEGAWIEVQTGWGHATINAGCYDFFENYSAE